MTPPEAVLGLSKAAELGWAAGQTEPSGVRTLTLDHPPPVNALGREIVESLGRAFDLLGRDAEPTPRV